MIKTNPVLLAHQMFVADREAGMLGQNPKNRVYIELQIECDAMEVEFDEDYADAVAAAYEAELDDAAKEDE